MAEVKFYPTKPRKQRVQLSEEELKLLFDLVWEKVKDKSDLNPVEQKIAGLVVKLGRAHQRAAH